MTGVLFRSDEKTVLPIVGSAIDEEVIHGALQDIAHAPYAQKINPARHEHFYFGFMNNVPLELYLRDGFVETAYPIFSFTPWQPGQSQILIAPITVNGVTRSLFASSDHLLSLAQRKKMIT